MTTDSEMFDRLLGDRLVCVRYRYDEQQKKRCKTVELIVEEDGWEPSAGQWVADRVVQLWVILPETEVRRWAKGAGGRWDPPSRLWALRYDRVVALGLEERIVGEARLRDVEARRFIRFTDVETMEVSRCRNLFLVVTTCFC